jgi:hypothetical protein
MDIGRWPSTDSVIDTWLGWTSVPGQSNKSTVQKKKKESAKGGCERRSESKGKERKVGEKVIEVSTERREAEGRKDGVEEGGNERVEEA